MIISDEEKRKAETEQARLEAELKGLSPIGLLAKLRTLLSDVTPKQSERDSNFLAEPNEEDRP